MLTEHDVALKHYAEGVHAGPVLRQTNHAGASLHIPTFRPNADPYQNPDPDAYDP
jgi:hypothetical protein